MRHVAYESGEPADRVRMHRRAGAYLAGLGGSVAPARIAKHHELAGERMEAARFYRDAGLAARAVYSNRDALRFFARALALLPDGAIERFDLHALALNYVLSDSRISTAIVGMRRIAEVERNNALADASEQRIDLDWLHERQVRHE